MAPLSLEVELSDRAEFSTTAPQARGVREALVPLRQWGGALDAEV